MGEQETHLWTPTESLNIFWDLNGDLFKAQEQVAPLGSKWEDLQDLDFYFLIKKNKNKQLAMCYLQGIMGSLFLNLNWSNSYQVSVYGARHVGVI